MTSSPAISSEKTKVTRSFEYLQGDYYIAPLFLVISFCHIVKNFISKSINAKVPLILGIWGGKGQGKTFQTELIFQTMGVEPVIMSAGELESERAGEPGKLIRERYRTASQVVQNQVRSLNTFTTGICMSRVVLLRVIISLSYIICYLLFNFQKNMLLIFSLKICSYAD
nr:ribulose bisphosphate carboxylase/oxygenase activase, chloroplastic isoform X1 [Ipomoea batatas]